MPDRPVPEGDREEPRPASGDPAPPERGQGWLDRLVSPYVLLAGTALIWSGNFVVGRAARDQLPPVALNFWRWTLALAILLALTGGPLWRQRRVLLAHWRILAGLAVSGIVCFHLFTYSALQSTEAINAVLVLSTAPMLIVLVAWVAFRDTITARMGAGIVVAMVGAVLVIARGDPRALGTLQANPGDLWMLAAALSWAVYSVLLTRRPTVLAPLVLLTATVAIGVAVQIPIYALALAAGERIVLSGASLAALGYVGVFASVIAYLFWNRGVREVGPARAGVFLHLMPLFGAGLAIVFLGERIAWFHLAGAAAIVVGIVLASRRPG